MNRQHCINLTCALCERPVVGVHYLWDTNGSETTVWFHGDQPEDQCFMHRAAKSLERDVFPVETVLTDE